MMRIAVPPTDPPTTVDACRAWAVYWAQTQPHRPQILFDHVTHVRPVDMNGAGVGLQQAQDEPQDGRLARPGAAQDDLGGAGGEIEAHPLENRAVEREVHVAERDDGLVGILRARRRLRGGGSRPGGEAEDGTDRLAHHTTGNRIRRSLVMKKSEERIVTDATTTDRVVESPTPCVPPEVLRPM